MKSKKYNLLYCVSRIILLATWSACVVLNPTDSVHDTNFVAEEDFAMEMSIESQKRLIINGINGSIIISGQTNANTVNIWGKRQVGSESVEDAEQHLADLKVDTSATTDEIIVRTIQPKEAQGRNYTVNYFLTLPIGFEVFVENINGQINIDSVHSYIAITEVNGQVILNAIEGSTDVTVVNGQIDGDIKLPLNGNINMNTVNGLINLNIPKDTSADLSANVVNGNITVSNLDVQDTDNSRISFRGKLRDGEGQISLSTVNGNILVVGK